MIEKSKTVKLNDEEAKQVAGGGSGAIYDDVTQLLEEAGDKAWAVLGPKNELWRLINKAQFARPVMRIGWINDAIHELENSWKNRLSFEDYDFIHQRLIESQQKSNYFI